MPCKRFLTELEAFIRDARGHGYGAGEKAKIISGPGGMKLITWCRGDWIYQDKYYGGEPYAGGETVEYKGRVIWVMVYYGSVEPIVIDIKPVTDFLQAALRTKPKKGHFSMRGPREFTVAGSEFVYFNECNGDVTKFDGREQIFCIRTEQYGSGAIYSARYMGGLVDQR